MGGEGHAELSPQITLTFSYSLSLTLLMYNIRNLLPPDPLEGQSLDSRPKYSIYYTQAKVMGNIKIRNWKSQVWYLEMSILESRKTKFSKQKCTY